MDYQAFHEMLERIRRQQEQHDEEMRQNRREQERRMREAQDQQVGLGQQAGLGDGGISPFQALNIAKKFGGGAGAEAGASSGAASSGAGSLASMWPAAVVVAAIANENYATKKGYRREGTDYLKDLSLGRVLYQDVDQRWAQKLTGSKDQLGLGGDMRAGSAMASFQPGKAWKHLKNDSTVGKLLKKIL